MFFFFFHTFQTKHDVKAHRVTSGATVGRMFFRMAWIQFLRIPEVMADSVNAPSLLWEEDKDTESIDLMHDSWTKRDFWHCCSISTTSATEYIVNPMSFYNFYKTFTVMITEWLLFILKIYIYKKRLTSLLKKTNSNVILYYFFFTTLKLIRISWLFFQL